MPSLFKYKSKLPKQKKILARTGKIGDTVEILRNTNWDTKITPQNTTQQNHDNFYEIINHAQDTSQPLKMFKVGLDKEWMNHTIKAKVKKR